MDDMRVMFLVRCTGKPDDDQEQAIMARISNAVASENMTVLTIGRQYFHAAPLCDGHPSADDDFCDYYFVSKYNVK